MTARLACVVVLALAACTDGVTLVTRDLGRDAVPPADAAAGGDGAPSADTAPPGDGARPADAITPAPVDAGADGASGGTDGASGAPDAGPDAAVDDFEALMAEGLRRLSVGQNHEARAPFDAALALRPTRADAAFALSLAETLDALELAGMLLTLPGQIAAISRNDAVAEALHGELLGIRDELARALDRVDALDPAEVTLDVPAAWIYLSAEPVWVYRGRFDAGDVHLYRAAAGFLTGLLDVLAANDLRTDLFGLINGIGGFGDLGVDFRSLGGLLGHVLRAEGGHFLGVEPTAGPGLWPDAQRRFASVGPALNAAVAWMAAAQPVEPGPDGLPVPEVSHVVPLAVGEGYTLFVQGVATQADDFTVSERPYEIDLPQWLLDTFARAGEAIATPGEVVDFQGEFLPILAVLVHVATRVHVLDPVLGALPIDLSRLNRAGIEGLLKTLLPLPVGMAPGDLYAAGPVGLRAVLPLVGEGEPARFVAEWECPDALDADGIPPGGGFVCPPDAVLVDAPHFGGLMPADGIATPGPYLRFEDAAMGGLAQVDLSLIDVPGAAPGWVAADDASTSTALAVGLVPLFTLLGGL